MWPQGGLGELSDDANIAEHYLDGRLPGTRSPHPHAANIDVVWLDPKLRNHLIQRWQSPDMLSPFWQDTNGRQVNPFFVGYTFPSGTTITPLMHSPEVLAVLGHRYPWQAFSYHPMDTSHFIGHAWPYEWYARTIETAGGTQPEPGAVWCPTLCWEKWGFVNSPMYADFLRRRGEQPVDRLTPLVGQPSRILPESDDCGE